MFLLLHFIDFTTTPLHAHMVRSSGEVVTAPLSVSSFIKLAIAREESKEKRKVYSWRRRRRWRQRAPYSSMCIHFTFLRDILYRTSMSLYAAFWYNFFLVQKTMKKAAKLKLMSCCTLTRTSAHKRCILQLTMHCFLIAQVNIAIFRCVCKITVRNLCFLKVLSLNQNHVFSQFKMYQHFFVTTSFGDI